MFEGIAAELLSHHLGDYIADLNREKLKVAVWAGDIVLENLKVKKEAFDFLELPIHVVAGTIGKLEAHVPWSRLKTEPVIVVIDDVLILTGPKDLRKFTQREEDERQQRIKQRKLDDAELLKQKEPDAEEESLTSKLATKIIDNIQVKINNVHIRYEDSITDPSHPFACGVTWSAMDACSSLANWEPTDMKNFKAGVSELVYKLVTMRQSSVYVDLECDMLTPLQPRHVRETLKNMIPHKGGPQTPHHYILQPQDTVLKLVMRRSDVPHMAIPKYNLTFELKRVLLSLQELQYRAILNTLDYLWSYDLKAKYRRLRPLVSVKEDKRAWWRFAIQSVLCDVREHRTKWTWNHIKQFRSDRRMYIKLYKKNSGVPWYPTPTEVEKARLRDTELRLSFQEIVMFRSLADAELKAEGETDAGKASKEKKKKKQNAGWLSRMFGSGSAKEDEAEVALTAAQREALYATIEYDPDGVLEAAAFPPDYVHVKINFSLTQGTIQLSTGLDPIARAVFEGVNFTTFWRAETTRTEAILTSLEVFDQFTKKTCFPRLLASGGDGGAGTSSLLELSYDSMPSNKVADASLNITLGGTDIYYVKPCIDRIYDFFYGEHLPETTAATGFQAAAAAQLASMKEHTLEQFRSALENRQKIDVTMDLLAPRVIFIEDATVSNCRIMVCDLGHFSLTSDLSEGHASRRGSTDNNKALTAVKGHEGRRDSSAHIKQIAAAVSTEDLTLWDPDDKVRAQEEHQFYDHYHLELKDITALLTTSDADWRTEQGRRSGDMHFVDKFDIRVDLQQLVISADKSGLAEYRFSGDLTPINVMITSKKYKDLMYIWDAFSDPNATTATSVPAEAVGASDLDPGMSIEDVVAATRVETSTRTALGLEPAFTQVLTEGRFNIPDVTITIAQEKVREGEAHQPIVSVRLGKLLAHYVQRPFDMRSVLSLRSLHIKDHFQNEDSPNFQYLVSSEMTAASVLNQGPVVGGASTSGPELDELFTSKDEHPISHKSDLISISYVAIDPKSPRYDDVDVHIDCKFNTLEVCVNRGTIAQLIEFAYAGYPPAKTVVAPEAAQISGGSGAMSAPSSPHPQSVQRTPGGHRTSGSLDSAARASPRSGEASTSSLKKPKPSHVVLSLQLSMNSLSVRLNYEDSTLALMTMTDARTSLTAYAETYQLTGQLGNLAIYNQTHDVGLYPQIFGLRSGDSGNDTLLKYTYTTYSDKYDDYPGYDMAMQLRTASVEIYHVHHFFSELQTFIMNGPWFTLFVQRYSDHSVEAMQAIANDVQRLSLDIVIENPLIHMPVHGGSTDMLVGDLGKLVISNSFHFQTDEGVEVPMTAMNVHLKDMNVTSLHDNLVDEWPILENTTMDIVSTMPIDGRHCSNTLPEMKVSGELSNMSFAVTEAQYELMLNVAFKNLLQGYDDSENNGNASSPAGTPSSMPSSPSLRSSDSPSSSPLTPKKVAGPPETGRIPVYDVDIAMRQISLRTFRSPRSGERSELFNLQFETLDLRYCQLKNASATASFFMQSVSLTDTREESPNHFKRMIVPFERVPDGDEEQRHVTMRYSIDTDENEAWDVELHHLQAMFIPDVMYEIKDYLVEPFFKVSEEANKMFGTTAEKLAALSHDPSLSARAQNRRNAGLGNMDASSSGAGSKNKRGPAERVRVGEMKARLFFTSPEIWLLEDPTDKESRCVVASSPFFLEYGVDIHGLERYKALVQQLKVYACTPYEAAGNNSAILDPVDFTIESQQTHLDPIERRTAVEFSTMDWRLTLADMQLVAAIIDNIVGTDESSKHGHDGEEGVEGQTAVPRGRAETVIMEEQADSLANKDLPSSPALESVLTSTEVKEVRKGDYIHWVAMTCQSIHLYFINDAHSVEVPFARFKMSGFETQMDVRGEKSSTKISTSLSADYHNVRNILWEPLIEPWNAILNMTSSPEQSIVSLASASTLNINVSSTFLADLKENMALMAMPHDHDAKKGDFSPYMIRNSTGLEFRYFVSETDIRILKPGDKSPVTYARESEYRGVRSQMDTPPHNSLSLQMKGGWYALRDIPMDKVTTRVFALKPPINDITTNVVCDISLEDGSKVLTVRSPIVIVNYTDCRIELAFRRKSSPSETFMAEVEAGAQYNVPLTWSVQCDVACRPSAGHQWGPFISINDLQDGSSQALHSAGTKQSPGSQWIILNTSLNPMTQETFSKLLVPHQRYLNLYPPLQLQNQLPIDLEYTITNSGENASGQEIRGRLEPGAQAALLGLDLEGHIAISVKAGEYGWSKNAILNRGTGFRFKGTLDDDIALIHSTQHMPDLVLSIDNTELEQGRREVAIFCNYWMVNKTGLDLGYKSMGGSEWLSHPSPIKTPRVALDGDPMPWNSRDSAPVLYSEGSLAFGQSKTCVRVQGSMWSKGFSMDATGYVGVVEIKENVKRDTQSRTRFMYELGVDIEVAPEQFHRSKIITFTPRYILRNELTRTLKIRQHEFPLFSALQPNQHLPFHWPDYDKPFLLTISFEEDGWEWTAPFELGALGDRTLKLRSNGPTRLVYMARVSVHMEGSMVSIIFRSENREHPPYKINNFSSVPIRFRQKDVETPWETLAPQQASRYCWDDTRVAPKLSLEFSGTVTKAVMLDSIREYHKVKIKGRTSTSVVHVYVSTDGPTKLLNIVNDGDLDPDHKLDDIAASGDGDDESEVSQVTSSGPVPKHISRIEYEIRLSAVGISLVDDTPLELMYASMADLYFHHVETRLDQEIELTLGKLQVDNGLPDCRYPVLLAPVPSERRNFIHVSIVRSLHVTGIDYFKYFSVLIQALSLNVDEALVTKTMDLVKRLGDTHAPVLEEEGPSNPPPSRQLYFDILHLHPLLINLSFAKTRDKDKQSSRKLAFRALGVALTNIDRAPMKFKALLLENPFETERSLVDRVSAFYWRQALEEFYVLLGSFEFLGNPVGLLSNVGTGVVDFFYEPAQGLIKSPQDFAEGLGRGTSSLVKNSVYGAFNTVSKMSGSVSKGLAGLSMDDDYKREREFRGRTQASSAGEGMLQGAKHFGSGLYDGITGVVTAPIQGAEKDGVKGFMKGIAKGVIGLGVKPVAGVFDLASKTTEGISNQVDKEKRQVERVRPPRTFGRHGELTVYNPDSARGQEMLYNLKQGRYIKTDSYHLSMPLTPYSLILTSRRIILVKLPLDFEWHVPYEYFRDVEVHPQGLRIITMPVPQDDLVREILSNAPQERWVPCSRGMAEILEEQIRHAFHLFATSGF